MSALSDLLAGCSEILSIDANTGSWDEFGAAFADSEILGELAEALDAVNQQERLLNAAPDLLAACKAALAELRAIAEASAVSPGIWPVLKGAITKAEPQP